MYCDLDGPEMYSAVDRVARKEHKCCECNAPIRKGEKYVECSGRWDGKFDVFRQHDLCCRACMFIRDLEGECLPFGEMMEWYHECYRADKKRMPKELRTMFAGILRRERTPNPQPPAGEE